MAQWWEHSPPTNVARVRILASTPYVGWVCCWYSPLLREVFLRVLRFSPLLKNQHFQIPIRSGKHGHVSTSSYEHLSDPWVNKLQFTILLQSYSWTNSLDLLGLNSQETVKPKWTGELNAAFWMPWTFWKTGREYAMHDVREPHAGWAPMFLDTRWLNFKTKRFRLSR